MIVLLCFMIITRPSRSSADRNETQFYIKIYDNFFDSDHILYGDLTKLDDMFLPPLDSIPSDTDAREERELAKRKEELFKWEDLDYLRPKVMTPDVAEFNEITKILKNETVFHNTRREMWIGWNDPQDMGQWDFEQIKDKLEYEKRDKLWALQMQWVMHARYQIKRALTIKQKERTDKRYKIGFLSSRMRIIKYDQQKITTYAHEQDKLWFRGLTSTLKLYEQMVRYDVDLRDAVNMIKVFNDEPVSTRATPPSKPYQSP